MDDADTPTGWFPPLDRDAALQDAISFAEDANGISRSMNDEQAACGCVGSSSGWLTRRHGKGKQKGVEEMSAMCRLLDSFIQLPWLLSEQLGLEMGHCQPFEMVKKLSGNCISPTRGPFFLLWFSFYI
ncbi:hypothetical protein VPH35_088690 [Triticum aestivum]